MTGTEFSFVHSVESVKIHLAAVVTVVDVVGGRQIEDVTFYAFEQCNVGIGGYGVVLVVVRVVELTWVYEYRNHCAVVFGYASTYKRCVSLVQCSHCRNKT